jgi:hypothetical protein
MIIQALQVVCTEDEPIIGLQTEEISDGSSWRQAAAASTSASSKSTHQQQKQPCWLRDCRRRVANVAADRGPGSNDGAGAGEGRLAGEGRAGDWMIRSAPSATPNLSVKEKPPQASGVRRQRRGSAEGNVTGLNKFSECP